MNRPTRKTPEPLRAGQAALLAIAQSSPRLTKEVLGRLSSSNEEVTPEDIMEARALRVIDTLKQICFMLNIPSDEILNRQDGGQGTAPFQDVILRLRNLESRYPIGSGIQSRLRYVLDFLTEAENHYAHGRYVSAQIKTENAMDLLNKKCS